MDSKTSSDEDPTAEGLGRSYECVFCKRGFTTAQALGGHMNIHRKERANKTRPSSAPNFTTTTTTSTNADTIDQATSLRSYPAIHQSYYSTAPDHDDHHLDHPHHHVNYRTYIPAPTWVMGPPHALHPSDDHEKEDLYSARNYPRLDHQSLFTDGQDSRSGSSLSLGIGPSSQYVDDDHHPNKQIQLAKSASCTQLGDAHELDLELRLGHDP